MQIIYAVELCSLIRYVVTTVMNVYFSIESKPKGENITLFYHFTDRKIHCMINTFFIIV